MNSMNRIFLSGNLGAKPEKKQSKNGREYYSASLASHRYWMNKEDEWESRTDWHTLFFWSPKAKKHLEQLEKGQSVVVDGELVTFERSDEEGQVTKSAAIEVKDLKALQKSHNPQ